LSNVGLMMIALYSYTCYKRTVVVFEGRSLNDSATYLPDIYINKVCLILGGYSLQVIP